MSPLAKYYGAIALFVLLLIVPDWIIHDPWLNWITIVGAFALFIYAMVIARCPQCRKRLAARRTWYSHGFPGRICPKCGTDLSKISN